MNSNIVNNYTPDPKIPEYRRSISFIGLGLFVLMALNVGTGHLFSFWLVKQWPILGDTSEIWYWLVDIVAQYGISFPAAIFIIRKASGSIRSVPAAGKPDMLLYIPVAFTGIFAGNMLSRIINSITDAAFGATSGFTDPEITGLTDAVMMTFLFAIAAPVMEELLFRKCLIDALKPYGEKTAIILSSLAFALAHRNIAQMFYAFATGIALGYVYLRSGKLRYGVMIHSLVNTIGSVIPLLAQAFLIDMDAYNVFYDAYMQLNTDLYAMTGETLTAFLEQLRSILPGLTLLTACNAVMEGLALAGLVLFFVKRRNIRFEKGEITISKSDIGYVFFEAPGMIAFILLSVTLTVLTYFA